MQRPNLGAVALLCCGLGLAFAVPASDARADDIKVLSTGNMQSILGALTADFEEATGNKLVIEYGSTTKMKARIEAGDAADLTINERYVLDDLLKQGRVEAGTLDQPHGDAVIGAGRHDHAVAPHQLAKPGRLRHDLLLLVKVWLKLG